MAQAVVWRHSEQFLKFQWLLVGLGLQQCWSSISFPVDHWQETCGDDMWQAMLVLYNGPGLAVLLLQLYSDRKFDSKFGLYWSYKVRMLVSLSLATLATALAPVVQCSFSHSTSFWMSFIACVGIILAAAHGWVFSLASLAPPGCVGYLLVGTGLATLTILADTLILNLSTSQDVRASHTFYFEIAAAFSLIGLISAFKLLDHPLMQNVFQEGISSPAFILLRENESHSAGNSQHGLDENTEMIDFNGGGSGWSEEDEWEEEVFDGLARHMCPSVCAVAKFEAHIVSDIHVSMICSFLTWMTVVGGNGIAPLIPSSGTIAHLPNTIMYISSLFVLIGSQAAIHTPPSCRPGNQAALLCLCVSRSVLFVFLLLYSTGQLLPLNDVLVLCTFAIFSFSAAYVTVYTYSIPASIVSPTPRAQASCSLWINISLNFGIYLGMMIPFAMK